MIVYGCVGPGVPTPGGQAVWGAPQYLLGDSHPNVEGVEKAEHGAEHGAERGTASVISSFSSTSCHGGEEGWKQPPTGGVAVPPEPAIEAVRPPRSAPPWFIPTC